MTKNPRIQATMLSAVAILGLAVGVMLSYNEGLLSWQFGWPPSLDQAFGPPDPDRLLPGEGERPPVPGMTPAAQALCPDPERPTPGERKRPAVTPLAQPPGADPQRPMPGEGKRPPVPDMTPAEMDDLIQQTKQATRQGQAQFLQEFVNGTRCYSDLPIGNSDIGDFLAPPTLPGAVAKADVIASVTATAISFVSSGMSDVPGSNVTLRIDRSVKGPLRSGTAIQVRYLGGPYRNPGWDPNGEESFFQLKQTPIPRPGEHLVLLLGQTSSPGVFGSPGPWGRFDLRDGRVIATSYNPLSQAVAGLTEEQLLTLLATPAEAPVP